MDKRDDIVCRPIGVIHSRFKDATGVPIQSVGAPDESGTLEVFDEFAAGLKDVDGFEYLIVLTHLHLAAHERLEVVPFLDTRPRGVFATRAPIRPNKIGLSIVRLVAIDGLLLRFAGNDMVDQTPVLDIKPYVPAFDVRATEKVGWFGAKAAQESATRSDDRMR
jgi:tRNA (adenine37-N6)-methyltransferase